MQRYGWDVVFDSLNFIVAIVMTLHDLAMYKVNNTRELNFNDDATPLSLNESERHDHIIDS